MRDRIIVVSNYCNGPVCCRHRYRIHLYNVITREMKSLPIDLIYPWTNLELFLGFDSVKEKYKLLHVIEFSPKIKVLTLGNNTDGREVKYIGRMSSLSHYIVY